MGGTQEALIGVSSDGDDSEHELGGEAMSVKSSFAGKRKRVAMPQDQPDALKSSLKAVAGRRPRVKSVLVIDVGGTSVKILATGQPESRSFRSGPKLTPSAWCQE